jgi:hypothetical protein
MVTGFLGVVDCQAQLFSHIGDDPSLCQSPVEVSFPKIAILCNQITISGVLSNGNEDMIRRLVAPQLPELDFVYLEDIQGQRTRVLEDGRSPTTIVQRGARCPFQQR